MTKLTVAREPNIGYELQRNLAIVREPLAEFHRYIGQGTRYDLVCLPLGLLHGVIEEHIRVVFDALCPLPATAGGRDHGRAHRSVVTGAESLASLHQGNAEAAVGG